MNVVDNDDDDDDEHDDDGDDDDGNDDDDDDARRAQARIRHDRDDDDDDYDDDDDDEDDGDDDDGDELQPQRHLYSAVATVGCVNRLPAPGFAPPARTTNATKQDSRRNHHPNHPTHRLRGYPHGVRCNR